MWLKNNRNLILMVLEPGKSKIKALAYLVSDEGPFPPISWFADSRLLPGSACGGRGDGVL